MESALVKMMFIVATIMISLIVFGLYSVYVSSTNSNLSTVNEIESISKSLEISISPLTFKACTNTIPLKYNVTFLSSVVSKEYNGKLIIVPFVSSPVPNPSLYIPSGTQCAVIMKGNVVSVNGPIYLPDGKLLGKVSLIGYEMNNGQTFYVNAKLTNGVVFLWVLIQYQGNYYRLGYTYVTPSDAGMGIFVTSSSGEYCMDNSKVNVNPPLYFSSNKGLVFGMWFSPYTISQSKSELVDIIFSSVNGKSVSITFYTKGSSLYVNRVVDSNSCVRMIYNSLEQGKWYFLSFCTGSQLGLPGYGLHISLYSCSKSRPLAQCTLVPCSTTANGYASVIQFGNSSAINVISQAVLSSERSPDSSTQVLNELLSNPYYYNNTKELCNIISNCHFIYAIVYWYFASPYYPPPTQVNAIAWYNQHDVTYRTCIYENGTNTYILT